MTMRESRNHAAAGAAARGRTVSGDSHEFGLLALSPLALLCLAGVSAIAYYVFSQLQITSTEQTILTLLQYNVTLNPGMTAQQAIDMIHGSTDHYETIAGAIGWAVQIALLFMSFPPDTALLLMHRKHNTQMSPSLAEAAQTFVKIRNFLMIVLIGGDILTDMVYVANGHTLVVFNGWTPSLPSIGLLIVAMIYPAAICFVTVFVGKYLFVFIGALVEKIRFLPKAAA